MSCVWILSFFPPGQVQEWYTSSRYMGSCTIVKMLRAPNLALSNSPNWLQLVSIIPQSPLVPHLLNANHL